MYIFLRSPPFTRGQMWVHSQFGEVPYGTALALRVCGWGGRVHSSRKALRKPQAIEATCLLPSPITRKPPNLKRHQKSRGMTGRQNEQRDQRPYLHGEPTARTLWSCFQPHRGTWVRARWRGLPGATGVRAGSGLLQELRDAWLSCLSETRALG